MRECEQNDKQIEGLNWKHGINKTSSEKSMPFAFFMASALIYKENLIMIGLGLAWLFKLQNKGTMS